MQRRSVATVGSKYDATEPLGVGAWYSEPADGKPRLWQVIVAACGMADKHVGKVTIADG